mmetsp:Transcript_3487/g.4973  ORF Transcript_3487/g.4973 Transcript_3487/m.4973 type:complete len:102 (-) Transcript_3487:418-723(-)
MKTTTKGINPLKKQNTLGGTLEYSGISLGKWLVGQGYSLSFCLYPKKAPNTFSGTDNNSHKRSSWSSVRNLTAADDPATESTKFTKKNVTNMLPEKKKRRA